MGPVEAGSFRGSAASVPVPTTEATGIGSFGQPPSEGRLRSGRGIAAAVLPLSAGTLLTMAIDRDVVLREALSLPTNERAAVAAELLASLDETVADNADDIRAEWAAELERRARRAISGEDPGEPWPDVRDRIRAKLAR